MQEHVASRETFPDKTGSGEIKFDMGIGLEGKNSNLNADLRPLGSKPDEQKPSNESLPQTNAAGKRVQIFNDDVDAKPKKKKVRPLTAAEKALKEKTDEVNATTRWLADSAFTTYFGKPAFHPYGKGNVNPTNLSQKLLTHNINGATGKVKAQFQQVYDSAMIKGLTTSKGLRVPTIPKTKLKSDKPQP